MTTSREPLQVAVEYAEAKSRQDVAAALACCTDDFVLEAPAFSAHPAGHHDVARDLRRFFDVFPDYRFATEGSALGDHGEVALWGRFQATSRIRLGPVRLPQRRIDLPATAIFQTRDGLLSRERFLFDGVTIAAQAGIPASLLRPAITIGAGIRRSA